MAALGMTTSPHFPKQGQVLDRGAVAVGRVGAGHGERASPRAHVVGGLRIHIRMPRFDQGFSQLVTPLKVVARVIEVALGACIPSKTEPAYGLKNAVDILLVFLDRIGVVKTHVAAPVVIERQAKVQTDGFGVPDVQITIGFGRKTGPDAGGI